MKGKAFISQPMTGHSEEEIAAARKKAEARCLAMGYEVADTVFEQGDGSLDFQLEQLGKALQVMARCKAVYVWRGWALCGGCRIEVDAAYAYKRKLYYEDVNDGETD